jgi:aminoglycoside/choline kinase family phosphotransferase
VLNVPDGPARITVDWVTETLERGGVSLEGRLRSLETHPVTGDGVFAQIIRLRLSYDGYRASDPDSLILKLRSPSEANCQRAARFDLYEREARFYEQIARRLDVRTPRCYWSCFDPATGQFGLLLEDLGRLTPGDQLRGLSIRHSHAAVKEIAALHTRWWESPSAEALRWMPALDGPVTRQLCDVYRESWPAFVAIHGDRLPQGGKSLGQQVGDRLEELLAGLSGSPATVIHGDLRAENLLFANRGSHPPAVIDWQLAARGRGAFDVAYLLCQSMTVTDRRRHERAILRSWHHEIIRNGRAEYSFDQAAADYKLAALTCLGYTVAGTALERPGPRGRAIARTLAARSFIAAIDLGANQLLDLTPRSRRPRDVRQPDRVGGRL